MLVYQGNLIAAFDVLEKEFEEHYLAPNGKSFEKLLVGCLTAIRYRRVPEKQRKHAFPTIPATEASQLTEELDRLAFVPSEAVINHPDRSEAYWTNRACLLLEKMIDSGFTPNLRIFDLFMRTFLLQGKYKRVFEMFKRMKDYDIKPDEIAYAIVLETLAVRQGDLDGAYQLLEEMNNSGIEMDLNIRTILINAHLHANDDEGAKRRFSELIEFRNHNVSSEKTQSLSDLIFAYGSLVNVFCRSGDMDEAQYIVRHEIPRVFGCTGNSVVYNNLMQGFCLNGDLTAAVAVFHEMRKLGIEPNITSYNILIGGHVRHENHQEALHWYQALIKNPVVKPNLVTYNIMINSHLKANDPASAEALHNRILEEGMLPDHGSIGPMVEYFSLKCDWPTVGRIIEHYREVSRVHGAKFHGKERGRVQYSEISAHNIVLHRMRKHGTVSAVLKHFLEVSNPDSSVPDAEDSDAEDSEDASETTYAPDFRTYDILIRSLGAMKETKSARRWFEDAMRRKVADIRLFNTMMAVYLDCGMPKDAVRVFRLIEEYGLKPDMLSVTLMFKATKGKKVETDEHGA
ncbi:hypothetical protein HDU84_003896 [Entophlyctis sp. JEL0112]|nr:hypothetical protein HDU84_003896 [Entophlyctis sp. JEL0112]